METDRPDKVAAFDSLFATNHTQILKILHASMNPAVQKHLAVYIKMQELRYTLSFGQNMPLSDHPYYSDLNKITDVFDEMFPFCTPNEKDKLQNFRNIYQNLQNMQEILQFMQMMQEISPELFSPSPGEGAPGGNNLGGPGIEELLQLFAGNFT